jgi:hypothetical protein
MAGYGPERVAPFGRGQVSSFRKDLDEPFDPGFEVRCATHRRDPSAGYFFCPNEARSMSLLHEAAREFRQ